MTAQRNIKPYTLNARRQGRRLYPTQIRGRTRSLILYGALTMFRSGSLLKLRLARVLRSIVWIHGFPLGNSRGLRWLFPEGALLWTFREIFRAGVVGNNALPGCRYAVNIRSDDLSRANDSRIQKREFRQISTTQCLTSYGQISTRNNVR